MKDSADSSPKPQLPVQKGRVSERIDLWRRRELARFDASEPRHIRNRLLPFIVATKGADAAQEFQFPPRRSVEEQALIDKYLVWAEERRLEYLSRRRERRAELERGRRERTRTPPSSSSSSTSPTLAPRKQEDTEIH